jgi:hypothetical protein
MSTSANSGCTDGECCTLHATGQGLPPAVLERIEIEAQIDPALNRCRDIIEKLWAPEDDGPGEAAVLEDELPVLPRAVRAESDCLRFPRARIDDTDREQVDPGHLEPRGLCRKAEGRLTADHLRRRHLSLLDGSRPEAVAATVMIHDVPDGEDVRVRGVHPVVDGDPDRDVEAGSFGELGVRHDSRGDQAKLGVDRAAVDQLDSGDSLVGDDALCLGPGE